MVGLQENIKFFARPRFRIRSTAALIIMLTGMLGIFIVVLVSQALATTSEEVTFSSPWHYECKAGLCEKKEITPNVTEPLSLNVCQLFCGDAAGLWPKPTVHVSLGNFVAHLDPDKIVMNGINPKTKAGDLFLENFHLLRSTIRRMSRNAPQKGGLELAINFAGVRDVNNIKLTLETPENYTLLIEQATSEMINATITADNYFGARNGLQTLSQLIVFDDLYNKIQIVRSALVIDGPVYPYRGILLDTSRNFIDKDTILRTIEGMGMSKLNTFHWHITDSHSFPYVSRSLPKMSKYGAYTPEKVYTHEDIQEIIKFGLLNGVRVLPEFDAPAHVGEGWQWVGDNATVCFKKEPWSSYCVEPPCGQLNPASEKVYDILEGIYHDMIEDFQPDIFHMGGDEVNINCWNSSDVITDWMKEKMNWTLKEESFIKLWTMFQGRAYDRLKKMNDGKDIPVVLWTSGLTSKDNLKYIDPKKYIIQIWTKKTDRTIGRLAKGDYRMIFSNYDALYLDCGLSAWVGEGTNWCSPYKGWQKIYENSPLEILKVQGFDESKKHLILGGEAALWSEQVDSASVDSRLWPRSAAMAERLWGEPESKWIHAEQRMLRHRERLIERGIRADSLEPEWCQQNQGSCYA